MFLQSTLQLFSEYPVDLYELSKCKNSIKDKVPLHVAVFILQLSKLHMIRFLDFLYEYLKDGSFKLLYMDTGEFLAI